MTGHFVYLVECSDRSLYTGYTTDPSRRLEEHNSGRGSRYTKLRRPVRLAYLEERPSRSEALSREIQIKRMSRREKLALCRKYVGNRERSSR